MRKTFFALSLCGLAMTTTGCSTWKNSTATGKKTKEPWSMSKLWKKEYQQAQSMAVIWSPDVMTLPGSTPTRGFGGRIYFYNELSQAIPVDGDLMVHGYLKHNPRADVSEQIAADKTFAFTSEQLTSHFSPSEIGASYSIWVPWDAADGIRTEVTLIPTFKGKDGTIVQGTSAKVNLPGKAPAGVESIPNGPMQTVSYSRHSIPTNPGTAKETMRTTTIAVPPSSTIGRPRAQSTFTLDGNSNYGNNVNFGNNANYPTGSSYSGNAGQPTPELSGSGVSVGGGASYPIPATTPVSSSVGASLTPDSDSRQSSQRQSSVKSRTGSNLKAFPPASPMPTATPFPSPNRA